MKKTVEVEMLVSQNSPDFGYRAKGEIFSVNADLAKLLEGRGILKIIKGVKDGDK